MYRRAFVAELVQLRVDVLVAGPILNQRGTLCREQTGIGVTIPCHRLAAPVTPIGWRLE